MARIVHICISSRLPLSPGPGAGIACHGGIPSDARKENVVPRLSVLFSANATENGEKTEALSQYRCLYSVKTLEKTMPLDLDGSSSESREGNGTPLQYSCLENPMDRGAWWATVHGVAKSQIQLSDFTFTFHFHALEKEMATHSSVPAWRIPGMGKPGGLPSLGSHRVGHD